MSFRAKACETVALYPENLLEGDDQPDGDRRWWAVYTKSRQEKVFCRQLLGLQIPHYLPLVKKINYTRGRKSSSEVPLFSGYVFMHGSELERHTSLTTNRISQILPVADGAKLRFDLCQISRLIASAGR